jgi:hypothetical protein
MSKKILKVSFQDRNSNLCVEQFLDYSNPLLNEWEVVFNDPSLRKADSWFVIEALNPNDTSCEVNPHNIFFGSAETAQNVNHFEGHKSRLQFLSQFSRVFTFHQYLEANAENSPPFLPWMINSNHGDSIWMAHERDVDFLENLNFLEKTKSLSIICSTQALTPAHEMRLRFTSKLKDYFGSELDWIGNGVNSVSEKWLGLNQYKYNIVLENQKRYNVITEKIGDAFLGLTYPYYWGAPNIGSIFDIRGLTEIDIEDFGETVSIIEHGLKSNKYEKNFDYIIKNKSIVLHEFNFINRMLRLVESYSTDYYNVSQVHLFDANSFLNPSTRSYSILQKSFENLILPIDEALGVNLYEIATSFYKLIRYNKLTKLIVRIIFKNV